MKLCYFLASILVCTVLQSAKGAERRNRQIGRRAGTNGQQRGFRLPKLRNTRCDFTCKPGTSDWACPECCENFTMHMIGHCAPGNRVDRLMRKSKVCICAPDPVTGRLNPLAPGPAQQQQNGGMVSPARPNGYPIMNSKPNGKKSIFGGSSSRRRNS